MQVIQAVPLVTGVVAALVSAVIPLVGDEVKSQVVRLDAATGTVLARTAFAAAGPDDPLVVLVAGQSTVWVLDRNVSRADPGTSRITRLLDGADPLAAVMAAPPR